MSLPNPKSPDHTWCTTFMVLFLGLLTSSQTPVERGLFSVISTGINVTLPVGAGLVLFPQLSSFRKIPLFFLSTSYFQRSSYAFTSSKKPSLAYQDSHYLNSLCWYHTRRDPITHQLHAFCPLSYSLKNIHGILMAP